MALQLTSSKSDNGAKIKFKYSLLDAISSLLHFYPAGNIFPFMQIYPSAYTLICFLQSPHHINFRTAVPEYMDGIPDLLKYIRIYFPESNPFFRSQTTDVIPPGIEKH